MIVDITHWLTRSIKIVKTNDKNTFNDDDFSVPTAEPAAPRDTLVNRLQGLFLPAGIILLSAADHHTAMLKPP